MKPFYEIIKGAGRAVVTRCAAAFATHAAAGAVVPPSRPEVGLPATVVSALDRELTYERIPHGRTRPEGQNPKIKASVKNEVDPMKSMYDYM